MPTLVNKKEERTLEVIHWINLREKFTFKEATDALVTEKRTKSSIGSLLYIMRRAGYISKGEERGKWIVSKICPDDADLSGGLNEFNGMF